MSAPHLKTAKVKICGITRLKDAETALALGVDALGLNFWPGTPRVIKTELAREIAALARGRALIIGVFVDASREEILRIHEEIGLDEVQLHGSEAPELLGSLGSLGLSAYKALGVAPDETKMALEDRVSTYPGKKLLLDTKLRGAMPGGTGLRFDWSLAIPIAAQRELILAGGLHPGNVREAIELVGPAWVDTASGVEAKRDGATEPGIKDADLMRAFIEAARGISAPLE